MNKNQLNIRPDNNWTLFLDRDGVINYEKHLDYINNWEEFKFYENALEAIKIFSGLFGKVIVVTNQKGIGKGVTKEEEVIRIHENLSTAVSEAGGRIDAIYFCSALDNNDHSRKPNPGMGLQAQKDFPEIDFSKTIMIGNNISDMLFGRNIGSINIFLTTTCGDVIPVDDSIDAEFPSLYEAAQHFQTNNGLL